MASSNYFSKLKSTTFSPDKSPPRPQTEPTQFRRRYMFDSLREKKLNFMKHFDVMVNSSEVLEVPTDYLRVYYTDFLQTAEEVGVNDAMKSYPAGSVEIRELRSWISEVKPRTRMDAYPLFILSQHLLSDVLTEKLDLFLSDLEEKKKGLEAANARIHSLETMNNSLEKRLEMVENERNDLQHLSQKHAADADRLKKRETELDNELAKAEDAKELAVKQVTTKLKEAELNVQKLTASLEETSMFLRISREFIEKNVDVRQAAWPKMLNWRDGLGDTPGETAEGEANRATQRAIRQWLGETSILMLSRHYVQGDGEICLMNDEFKDLCVKSVNSIEALVGCKSAYVAFVKSNEDPTPPAGKCFEYLTASQDKKFLEGQVVPKTTPSYAMLLDGKKWVEVRGGGGGGNGGGYVAQALLGKSGDIVGFIGMDTLSSTSKMDIFHEDAVALLTSLGSVLSESYGRWVGLADESEEEFGPVYYARRYVEIFGGGRGGQMLQALGNNPLAPSRAEPIPPKAVDLDKAVKLKDDIEKKMFLIRKKDVKDMKMFKKPPGLVVQIWQAVFSLIGAVESVQLDSAERSWKAIVPLLIETKTKETPVTIHQRLKDFNPLDDGVSAGQFNAGKTQLENMNDGRVRQGPPLSVMLYIWARMCVDIREVNILSKQAPPSEPHETK